MKMGGGGGGWWKVVVWLVCYLKWWWPRALRSQTRAGGEGVGGGRWWCGVLLEVVAAAGIEFANMSGGRGVAPPAIPACLLIPACACTCSFVPACLCVRSCLSMACSCSLVCAGPCYLVSFVCVKYKVSKHIIIKLLTFTSEL